MPEFDMKANRSHGCWFPPMRQSSVAAFPGNVGTEFDGSANRTGTDASCKNWSCFRN